MFPTHSFWFQPFKAQRLPDLDVVSTNLEPFHGLSHSWTCPVCCLNTYKIFYLYVTSDFMQILPGWRVLFFQVIVFNNFSHGNNAPWIWSFLLLFSDLSLFLFWNRGPQLQSVVKMQVHCGSMLRNNYVLWLFLLSWLYPVLILLFWLKLSTELASSWKYVSLPHGLLPEK